MKLVVSLIGLLALTLLALAFLTPSTPDDETAAATAPNSRPNILLIVADDLGYRDLGCYGATKIETPHIDRLAREGVRFTDAHSICAVCQPARYGILCGTYFRNSQRVPGYSLYFHEDQVTLPALLNAGGYQTAAVGKWHSGFGRGAPDPDWNAALIPGPLEIGFDYFFGTPKSHNEPPFVFVEGHHVVGLDPADPIEIDDSRGFPGFQRGGTKARATRPDDQIDFIVAERASQLLAGHPTHAPFFLYVAFNAPHVPINPAREFRGKSEAGLYGDYVEQLDHCTGLVLDALEKSGHAQNTLVLFTSDNGGVYHSDALGAGHRTNGELLGQKTDAWEGGHRVPLVARWPQYVPGGTIRNELFSQIDLMATFAEVAQIAMPAGASPDGHSELAAFTDPKHAPAKRMEAELVGTAGSALRQGEWLFIPRQGSGGETVPETPGKPWSQPYADMAFSNSDLDADGTIQANAPARQLYNLSVDTEQQDNVINNHLNIASKMHARMRALKMFFGRPAKAKATGSGDDR